MLFNDISLVLLKSASEQWQDINEPLARYVKLRVAHAPGTFSPPSRVSDHDMQHGIGVTHVPWCMPGSLFSGFLWSRWREKRSRHSRCMRNPQFYVAGKRPIGHLVIHLAIMKVQSKTVFLDTEPRVKPQLKMMIVSRTQNEFSTNCKKQGRIRMNLQRLTAHVLKLWCHDSFEYFKTFVAIPWSILISAWRTKLRCTKNTISFVIFPWIQICCNLPNKHGNPG